jgi:hypothetical protein
MAYIFGITTPQHFFVAYIMGMMGYVLKEMAYISGNISPVTFWDRH